MFLGVFVGGVFFGAVLPMFFCFIIWVFAPETDLKNSLVVRSGVSGFFFSPPFGFFADVVAFFVSFSFFFQRDRSGSHRAHPHTHFLFFVLFLSVSPPHSCCSPVLAVRPFFLAFCRGAILGPGRFLDSLGTSLRPFSRTRGGKGVFLLLVPCFVFPRFVLFCGRTLFLEARVGFLAEVGSPV